MTMKDPAVKRMKHRKIIKDLNGNWSLGGCCEGWGSPAAPCSTPSTPLPPPGWGSDPRAPNSRHFRKAVWSGIEVSTAKLRGTRDWTQSTGCLPGAHHQAGKGKGRNGKEAGKFVLGQLGELSSAQRTRKTPWEKQSLEGTTLKERRSSMNFILYLISEK